jgi:hypothetical protein
VKDAIKDLLLLPDDILCVFLFVSKNAFGDQLRDALHSLWRDNLDDAQYRQMMLSSRRRADAENYFAKYDAETRAGRYVWLAHFHRSEEGRPIQTKDSAHSTRMVSVHAAQGDGRRLALVFQLSEMGIKQSYTRGEENLCYYSFINVACSRAKTRTIVFQGKVYDDVWRRFLPYMDKSTRLSVDPCIRIKSSFPINRVSFHDASSSFVQALALTLLPHLERAEQVKDPQPLVDFEHHQVRAATFRLIILLRILGEEVTKNVQKKQVIAMLREVARLPVRTLQRHWEYHRKLSDDVPDCIPLLDYARSPTDPFAAICREIRSRLEEQQRRIQSWLGEAQGQQFTTLLDALTRHPKDIVALMYAIECTQHRQWLVLKVDAVYDIFKSFGSDTPLTAHFCCLARAREVAEKIVAGAPARGGGGEWRIYLRVTLGQPSGEALPHFSFPGLIDYVYVTDGEATVVECRQQVGTALLGELSSALTGHVALLRQPAIGSGTNYERFSGKRLSFMLVSMCTGWTGHVEGFEGIFQQHKEAIYDSVCRHAETACRGFHDSVLNFHECCHGRGEHSIARFRALKDAADKSKRVWAPDYIEDSLAQIQRVIDDAEEDGAEPLPEFGRARLGGELSKGLRRSIKELRGCLLPVGAAAATARVEKPS